MYKELDLSQSKSAAKGVAQHMAYLCTEIAKTIESIPSQSSMERTIEFADRIKQMGSALAFDIKMLAVAHEALQHAPEVVTNASGGIPDRSAPDISDNTGKPVDRQISRKKTSGIKEERQKVTTQKTTK